MDIKEREYSVILDEWGYNYIFNGHYLLVGKAPTINHKRLYISVIQSQIQEVLLTLVPYLFSKEIPFHVIKNRNYAELALNGSLGPDLMCKIIIIYLSINDDIEQITQELMTLVRGLKGPKIPNHLHLGELLYTDSFCNQEVTDKQYQILNNSYLVTSILKQDVKGDVFKCVYVKGFLKAGTCIIKKGNKHMLSDDIGRDIEDRLKWQLRIHKDLSGVIYIPKILDFFEEKGDSYLCMEFIKGKTLGKMIDDIYKSRSWLQLKAKEKLEILKLLFEVIKITEKIHQKGYVHRDLTSENFLITTRRRIYAIDLEFAFNVNDTYPSPPFQLGTFGYMSSEQLDKKKPTFKEDIYALGALMIVFFTNIQPFLFDANNKCQIVKSIFFFTGNSGISHLIKKCLDKNPNIRPEIKEIKNVINSFLESQKKYSENKVIQFPELLSRSIIERQIISALEGLDISTVISDGGGLNLLRQSNTRFKDNGQSSLISGLMSPATGIIYMIFIARRTNCKSISFESFMEYFNQVEKISINQTESKIGLFYGSAGNALSIHYGIMSGIIKDHPGILDKINNCFIKVSDHLDLADGVAGQMLAALLIYKTKKLFTLENKIFEYLTLLLNKQNKDGSWSFLKKANEPNKHITGLSNGISGIIFVLIEYDKLFPSEKTKIAIKKALNWLSNRFPEKRRRIFGKFEDQSLLSGSFGVVLTFLFAYEHLGDLKYRDSAENYLMRHPSCPVTTDYSISTGITGRGFVYTEAFRICNNKEWKNRVTWIYNVLINISHLNDSQQITWKTGGFSEQNKGWLNGPAGIILLLLQIKNTAGLCP